MPRAMNKRDQTLNNELTPKQRAFIDEWFIDRNATQAAIRVGYKGNRISTTASELMRQPLIQKEIARREKELALHFSDRCWAAVEQLFYCITREGTDFIDENGKIITDLRKLPRRAAAAVDGIKQTVTTWTDESGVEHEKVVTELKLASKLGSIELGFKHKGLLAPTQSETTHKVTLDIDGMYERDDVVDDVENKILEVEALRKS